MNNPVSPLYKDLNFTALTEIAANETGCPQDLIEKDYWISITLQALATSEHGNDVIFKGGTSLSKAWHLVDRFSEDIDILIDHSDFTSKQSKRKKISQIRKLIESVPGLTYSFEQSFQGELNADYVFLYPAQIAATGPFEAGRIKLEIGFRGGPHPNSKKEISSILGNLAKTKGVAHQDLEPFKMLVLDTRRTFVEKLFAIHDAFERGVVRKKTRHYYDIHKLYETEHVREFVGTSQFLSLCEEVCKSSLEFFQDRTTAPIKEILKSPALTFTKAVRDDVLAGFKDDRLLYYKAWPNISEIERTIKHIQQALEMNSE